jgi:hypothetical protein
VLLCYIFSQLFLMVTRILSKITSTLKGTWLMLVTISRELGQQMCAYEFELHGMPSVKTPSIPCKPTFRTIVRYFHYGRECVRGYCMPNALKFWAYLCTALNLFQTLAAHGPFLHIWGMRGNYTFLKTFRMSSSFFCCWCCVCAPIVTLRIS